MAAEDASLPDARFRAGPVEKVGGRWHMVVGPPVQYVGEGAYLCITRKGIEVSGYYDGFVGLEGPTLTWEEFDAMRDAVAQPALNAPSDPCPWVEDGACHRTRCHCIDGPGKPALNAPYLPKQQA